MMYEVVARKGDPINDAVGGDTRVGVNQRERTAIIPKMIFHQILLYVIPVRNSKGYLPLAVEVAKLSYLFLYNGYKS